MQRRRYAWLMAVAGTWAGAAVGAGPDAPVVLAGTPTDLAVTIYRSPYRRADDVNLDALQGFALIRETRTVRLTAGVSRVRFEGVADGIEPDSAIVSGLANGILEKNLDEQLLSAKTLIARAAGRSITLIRTFPKTDRTEEVSGTLLTGPDSEGVVFRTADGIEALRCSGLSETFTFTDAAGLTSSPALSVQVRATQPTTQQIQLAYLAHGFDWAADYTATVSKDGRTVDLGAWVTLTNGNGTGFPAARTQVVAGRLNRESGGVQPLDAGGPLLARCWPAENTSASVEFLSIRPAYPLGFAPPDRRFMRMVASAADASMLQEVSVTGARVKEEQLGDLKLYRVPQRTTVASRQSKQVRLLDRFAIPVRRVYRVQLENGEDEPEPRWIRASLVLRTRNVTANHLGVPLPSGRIVVLQNRDGAPLLLNQSTLRDLAVNEEVEIDSGESSDVQMRNVVEDTSIDPATAKQIPLIPGAMDLRITRINSSRHVDVTNARDASVDVELTLDLIDQMRVIRADHPMGSKNGHPIFRLTIPAHAAVVLRYQTAVAQARAFRP